MMGFEARILEVRNDLRPSNCYKGQLTQADQFLSNDRFSRLNGFVPFFISILRNGGELQSRAEFFK